MIGKWRGIVNNLSISSYQGDIIRLTSIYLIEEIAYIGCNKIDDFFL